MNKEIMEMAEVIRRARQELGSGLILPEETATALHKAGYRKQSDTITFYKDPNIKDWAESEYAWCERPCDSNMSMRAIDKKGSIVGYASEHYWTWCDVKEVKKVSAIEFMRHLASKQSGTVEEFAKLKGENESLKKQLENAVVLPCKVGDKVYTVYNHWNYPNQHFVQSHQVDKFMVWNKDTILTIAHTGNFGLRDLNKTWFLTKPEAEARLAELKEEQNAKN